MFIVLVRSSFTVKTNGNSAAGQSTSFFSTPADSSGITLLWAWRADRVLLRCLNWLRDERGDVPGCLGFGPRFLQKTQISKPINKPILPGSKGNPVPFTQPGAHPAPIRHLFTGMPAVAIDMHFDIRDPGMDHCGKVFIIRYRMATLT